MYTGRGQKCLLVSIGTDFAFTTILAEEVLVFLNIVHWRSKTGDDGETVEALLDKNV